MAASANAPRAQTARYLRIASAHARATTTSAHTRFVTRSDKRAGDAPLPQTAHALPRIAACLPTRTRHACAAVRIGAAAPATLPRATACLLLARAAAPLRASRVVLPQRALTR